MDKFRQEVANATNLAEDELEHEYSIRGLDTTGTHRSLRAPNLTAIMSEETEEERAKLQIQQDRVDQVIFEQTVALVEKKIVDIQHEVMAAGQPRYDMACDRLSHYYRRLLRYPKEQQDSIRATLTRLELVMTWMVKLKGAAEKRTEETNTTETEPAASEPMLNSTINGSVPSNIPSSTHVSLNTGANQTTIPSGSAQQSSANHTNYEPTAMDLSMWANGRTPQVNFGPPPASLQQAYLARAAAASTQLRRNLLEESQLNTSIVEHGDNRPVHPIAPVHGQNAPIHDGSTLARLPGADLRSLKQFMGNRFFDGSTVDKSHMNVEEFILAQQMFARSTPGSDETIMRNMASLVTGKALTWWSTEINNIRAFPLFTSRLRESLILVIGTE